VGFPRISFRWNKNPAGEQRGETSMSKALLYDATMCIGCKQCEQACAEQNELPYDDKVAAESVAFR
jgi:Fe-S-cluster-containing dehydrogenase component